jgi:DNA-binding HxlR family transcriptional regulator
MDHHERMSHNPRSSCPVACMLDLVGDRWTMLVIRDLFLGRTRYKEFADAPEGIPTNILAERLERLVESGLVKQELLVEGGKRMCYRLTPMGRSLRPVLEAMRDWGLTWIPETKVMRTSGGLKDW